MLIDNDHNKLPGKQVQRNILDTDVHYTIPDFD